MTKKPPWKNKPNRAKKYITRMDYSGTHGWVVRWSPSGYWEDDTKSKFFSDGKFNGKAKALKAAQKFRDKIYKELITDDRHSVKRHKRNTSGIIGVRLGIIIKGIYEYYEWSASGHKNGKHWRKSFSIKKYGEKGAFLWACRERYKRHGVLNIHCNLKDLPCKPDVPFIKHRNRK